MADLDEGALDARLTRLEQARTWSPRLVSRLESLVRRGDDYDLFRINPIQYAKDHGIDEVESIDLFLHAARVGLFELRWHLVCPFCGHVVESLGDLSTVHSHFKCTFCQADAEVSLDDYIQVAFTISPQVRAIRFHEPERLDIEDYYFRYHFGRGLTFPNGMTVQQISTVVTRFMGYVAPGETVVIETEIPPGRLLAKDLLHRTALVFFLEEPRAAHEAIPLRLRGGKLEADSRPAAPRELEQPEVTFRYDATCPLESGKLRLEYENRMERRSPLWLMFLPASFQSSRVRFAPCLTGKRLLTSQTFRDLFRAQAPGADEELAVEDLTFLFTDLKGSTDMYDRIGDLDAFYLVRQHFDTLTRAIASHRGAVVKTIGDAVMATFATPADALRAALDMLAGLRAFNATISEPLHLKVGIHRGASIAVTLNDRLDYFGQTVNVAARIQGLAGADEIYLSRSAHDEPGVADLLTGHEVTTEQVALKGVAGEVEVRKVAWRGPIAKTP